MEIWEWHFSYVAELTDCEHLCLYQPWQVLSMLSSCNLQFKKHVRMKYEGSQNKTYNGGMHFFFFLRFCFLFLLDSRVGCRIGWIESLLAKSQRLRGFSNPPFVPFQLFHPPAFCRERKTKTKKKHFAKVGEMEFCLADICGCLHWHGAKLPDFPIVQSITVQ